MGSNSRLVLFILVMMLFSTLAKAQSVYTVTGSFGYRAHFSKSSVIDIFTTHSTNYHVYSPGYVASLMLAKNRFYIRPSFSSYGVTHSHGVFNPTIFSHRSPKNRNITNTNSVVDLNLDFGYEFPIWIINFRFFVGGGWISTTNQDWKTENLPALMIGGNDREATTHLTIFSEAFFSQSFTSSFGFGWSFQVYNNLTIETDISYQTHISTLAANKGEYRTRFPTGNGLGGDFASFFVGAWNLQIGFGYRLDW